MSGSILNGYFRNRTGDSYIGDDGNRYGWDRMWQRFMARVLAETAITERLTGHDLRARAGSGAGSLELAQKLLAHTDPATINRIYRRKPTRVEPVK